MASLDPVAGLEPSPDAGRRRLAMAKWRRRSRLVHFYRRALPGAMAALVLFGLGWMLVRSLSSGLDSQGVGAIHLLHPVFYGRNERGERYVLAALEAVRDANDPDRVALTLPRLKQFTGAPEPQTVTSSTGVYHEKNKLLDLFGRVRASDGQGNHFASETAYVNMRNNSVRGQSAASGSGPQGTFSANAYVVYDKGAHIVLTGNVHTHLVNDATTKSSLPRPLRAPAR